MTSPRAYLREPGVLTSCEVWQSGRRCATRAARRSSCPSGTTAVDSCKIRRICSRSWHSVKRRAQAHPADQTPRRTGVQPGVRQRCSRQLCAGVLGSPAWRLAADESGWRGQQVQLRAAPRAALVGRGGDGWGLHGQRCAGVCVGGTVGGGNDMGFASDAGIRTDLRAGSTISGDLGLAEAPIWGSGGFAVQQLDRLVDP